MTEHWEYDPTDLVTVEIDTAEPEVTDLSLDPPDLIRLLEDVLDNVDLYLIEGGGTVVDRLRLARTLSRIPERVRDQHKALANQVFPDIDAPVLVDEEWFKPTRARTNAKGWDREALDSAVNRIALERAVDTETGELIEPTAQEAVARMWTFVKVAEGRTAVLAAAGITADEYAKAPGDFTDAIEVVGSGSTTSWKVDTVE